MQGWGSGTRQVSSGIESFIVSQHTPTLQFWQLPLPVSAIRHRPHSVILMSVGCQPSNSGFFHESAHRWNVLKFYTAMYVCATMSLVFVSTPVPFSIECLVQPMVDPVRQLGWEIPSVMCGLLMTAWTRIWWVGCVPGGYIIKLCSSDQ